MPRYDDFRSSTGSLGGVSNSDAGGGGGGGGRWDAERFARERQERHADTRAPPVLERERPYDGYGRDERERDRFERRAPTFEERFLAGERYGPPARRPDREYEDEHLVHNSSMVPFVPRRRREPAGGPPPSRPGLLRRQSSLDTFDRKPMRSRYNDYDRDEYSPPPPSRAIPVSVPLRQRTPPRYHDREYEDVRVAEPEYFGDEEYRHVREQESTRRRRRSSSRERRPMPEPEEKPFPRRGKTRMPKRMVHTRAVIELGYPFEEIVRKTKRLRDVSKMKKVMFGANIVLLYRERLWSS